ncbi:MAG TPA: DUF4411 family protein [Herpetosiphonaceae bacterium]
MLYLLDANVLITAHNSYYAIDSIPEFWGWLVHMGQTNQVKIPIEVIEEIQDGTKNDLLYDWIRDQTHLDALTLNEEVDVAQLQRVISQGYAPDLTDDEIELIGRDPFLVAYALAGPDRCVVTTEVSKPSKKRQNRKLPDVCNDFTVQWCNTFTFIRHLGFRTSWRG